MTNRSIYHQLGSKRLEQLDGLRGLCSLSVLINHALAIPFTYGPLIGYEYPELVTVFQAIGAVSVIIFFVLSGFVIGYTTPPKHTTEEAKKYVLRRLIRLYPIYLFAIILTYLLSNQIPNLKDILGNLIFMQGWFVPIEHGNDSLWTLHYEFMFYLLFLLIWKFNLKIENVILVCFYCAILTIFFAFHPLAILGYFTIWLAGYWLSQNLDYLALVNQDYLSYKFWSPLILIVISFMGIQELLIHSMSLLAIPHPFPRPVFTDVIFSALAISIVASLITKKKTPFYLISFVLISLIRLGISIYAKSYHIYIDNFTHSLWGLVILSLSFFLRDIPVLFFKKLTFIGSFSYALYLVHYPILCLVNRLATIENIKSKLPFSLLTLTIIAIFISIFLAWFLECRLQMKIAKNLKSYFEI